MIEKKVEVPVISNSLAQEIEETIKDLGGSDGSFYPDVVYDSIISGEGNLDNTYEAIHYGGHVSPLYSLIMKCLIVGYKVEDD